MFYLRGLLYIILCLIWINTLNHRIINDRIRTYLMSIGCCIMLWIASRVAGEVYAFNVIVGRYLWYMSYAPIVAIPTLTALLSTYLGETKDHSLPLYILSFPVISAAFVLLVMTNDLHQLVFSFPGAMDSWSDQSFTYGLWYIALILWMIGLVVFSMINMIKRCRIPDSGKMLMVPLIPLILMTAYSVLYVLYSGTGSVFFTDHTAVQSVLAVAAIECSISTGLIQSNRKYEELLRLSTIGAQIIDSDLSVLMESKYTRKLSEDEIRAALEGPVILEDGIRLTSAPLTRGNVVWQEDIRDLLETLKSLEDDSRDLQNENLILKDNYQTERRIQKLSAQNKLYDSMQRQTATQIKLMERLIDDYKASRDPDKKKDILGRTIIVGSFLKRRENLIFIGEKDPMIPEKELEYCFRETLDNLKFNGLQTGMYYNIEGSIPVKQATSIYDMYELFIEKCFGSLKALMIRLYRNCDDIILDLDCILDMDLKAEQLTGGRGIVCDIRLTSEEQSPDDRDVVGGKEYNVICTFGGMDAQRDTEDGGLAGSEVSS